jgi:hypothetical protein
MLRFTLQRPSLNSAACTCRHPLSCHDLSGCVHLGVCPVPAGNAREGHLPATTVRCDVLAGVTGLRRAGKVDLLDPPGCSLFQPGHEQATPSFEDGPVEAGPGANKSWRRCARTSLRGWSTSTQPKTMSTYWCTTHPRWRSATWSAPSQASDPDGYGKTSSAKSTRQQLAAESAHRHTWPDHGAAHRWPASRTTSQARSNPTKKDFLPDLKDRVCAPDRR